MNTKDQTVKIIKDKNKVYEGKSRKDSLEGILGVADYLVTYTDKLNSCVNDKSTIEIYNKSLEVFGLIAKYKREMDRA